jgi:hypothetical protein
VLPINAPTPWVGKGKGLNPGLIETTPFYHNAGPGQAKYYWGSHPFQEGPTFNAESWNNIPNAPAQGFGGGQMAQPLTSQQLIDTLSQMSPFQPGVTPGFGQQIGRQQQPQTAPGMMPRPQPVGPQPVPGFNPNQLQGMSQEQLNALIRNAQQGNM